jgi:membrane-associated protein
MFDIEAMLSNISVVGALAIIGALVFAESAFLFGMFVPGGDTLLLVAGVFAAAGTLPLGWVIAVVFVAAAAGDNVGYYIGQKSGPRIFKKENGIFFRREYAERAAEFYERHGGKTVVIARFIAYVRTFAPLVAGVARMPHSKFIFYNIFGALFWTISLVMLGFLLGKEFAEQIERYILPVSILCILMLFAPTIAYFVRRPEARRNALAKVTPKRRPKK